MCPWVTAKLHNILFVIQSDQALWKKIVLSTAAWPQLPVIAEILFTTQ